MSNQNSTSTLPNPQALASFLYKSNMAYAALYRNRAAECDTYGETACATINRQNQERYEAEAAKYAPKPVTPWCPIARSAFLFAGPGRVATGQWYCARDVRYVRRVALQGSV